MGRQHSAALVAAHRRCPQEFCRFVLTPIAIGLAEALQVDAKPLATAAQFLGRVPALRHPSGLARPVQWLMASAIVASSIARVSACRCTSASVLQRARRAPFHAFRRLHLVGEVMAHSQTMRRLSPRASLGTGARWPLVPGLKHHIEWSFSRPADSAEASCTQDVPKPGLSGLSAERRTDFLVE